MEEKKQEQGVFLVQTPTASGFNFENPEGSLQVHGSTGQDVLIVLQVLLSCEKVKEFLGYKEVKANG